MQEQGRGKIVNISSSRVWDGTPNRLHYTTSKAGVIGFTRALAREVGEFGITVNAITPGLTLSDTQVASSSDNYLARDGAGRAIERPQVPEDLVGAVMFLSSAGERLHHRPDHQRRRRQGDALAHMAANRIGQRRSGAFVGDLRKLGARHAHEQFERKVSAGAGAGDRRVDHPRF